jgi:hypothetical protein
LHYHLSRFRVNRRFIPANVVSQWR